jgi:hypothetical protein
MMDRKGRYQQRLLELNKQLFVLGETALYRIIHADRV